VAKPVICATSMIGRLECISKVRAFSSRRR
jgi:hypothetical protein